MELDFAIKDKDGVTVRLTVETDNEDHREEREFIEKASRGLAEFFSSPRRMIVGFENETNLESWAEAFKAATENMKSPPIIPEATNTYTCVGGCSNDFMYSELNDEMKCKDCADSPITDEQNFAGTNPDIPEL